MKGLFDQEVALFPTSIKEIMQRIRLIDPVKYGQNRNYIDGAVTYLSPYISRGVISTKLVFSEIIQRGYKSYKIEKFIQELAWRDYWQQIWIAKGEEINSDLKNQQQPISNYEVPSAIVNGKTGIEAIDDAITKFYKTGYIHNHVRMYIASIACNIGESHWKKNAQWMYYHLLDADWASNALSWQWVAGSNSHKKYYANQDNINKFCYSQQKKTFLDVTYDSIASLPVPDILKENLTLKLTTPLPESSMDVIDEGLPTLIYNFYNLDPYWKKDLAANRILLLEPSHFLAYPISQKSIDFMISLSNNIPHMQIFVGEFDDLVRDYGLQNIVYKEHPLNSHYHGSEDSRDWIFDVDGYYPSFFSFWKKCKKQLDF